MQEKLKLTYFDGPGRAEHIRLLFYIGGIEFEDQRLTGQQFGLAKAQGKFKYGQLPVLEIDGKQYAQSYGILNYAAIKSGLFPKDPLRILQIEQVIQNIDEIIQKLSMTMKMKDEEQRKAARQIIGKETIPLWFQRIEDLLKENGSTGYVSGNELTHGDIVLYTNVNTFNSGVLDHIPKNISDNYPEILKVLKNVNEHPRVKDWYAKNPPRTL